MSRNDNDSLQLLPPVQRHPTRQDLKAQDGRFRIAMHEGYPGIREGTAPPDPSTSPRRVGPAYANPGWRADHE